MLIVDPDTGHGLDRHQRGRHAGARGPGRPAHGEKVTGVTGYESLNLGTLSQNADYKAQWDALQPPLDPVDRAAISAPISVTKADRGAARLRLRRGPGRDGHTATGEVYPADENGRQLRVGRPARRCSRAGASPSGSSNYPVAADRRALRSAFLPITAWTFFFAFATTFLNFSLGLMLALVLSERRMRGQGIYRMLLILPYGLPVLLMTLVWKGMLNTDFGLINSIARRADPVAHRPVPGPVLRAHGQPVAGLPVLLPGLLRAR